MLPAFIVMLALTSCVEDRLDDDFAVAESPSAPREYEYVIAIDIQTTGDMQTRAGDYHSSDEFENEENEKIPSGDFVYGSEDEHALIGPTGNYIFLFSKEIGEDGEVIEDSPETLMAIKPVLLPKHTHNPAGSENSGGGVKKDKDDNGGNDDEDDNIEEKIEARYESRIKLRNDEFPTSCLLLLNGKHLSLNGKSLDSQLEEINEAIEDKSSPESGYTAKNIMDLLVDNGIRYDEEDKKDEDGDPLNIGRDFDADGKAKYFTMSNSIYVKDNKLQAAVPITPDIIQDADNYDPKKKPLTIYVERMVAKFTLKLVNNEDGIYNPGASADDDESGENTPDDGNIDKTAANPLYVFAGIDGEGITSTTADWRVQLKGWGINALETKNYVYKHIYSAQDISFPDGWIFDNNPRTYWSIDYHYQQEQYPWQYRNMFDRTYDKKDKDGNDLLTNYDNFDYYENHLMRENGKLKKNDNYLRNYSYNELEERSRQNFDRVVYVPENTYDYLSNEDKFKKALDDRPHLLAGTHLLVGAELQIDLDGNGEYKAQDLYRDRHGIYYTEEIDCLKSLIHSFNRTLSSQSSMEFTYYNWDGRDAKNGTRYAIRPTADASAGRTYSLYATDVFGNYQKLTIDTLDDFLEQLHNWRLANAYIKDGDGKRMPWIEAADFDIKFDIRWTDDGTSATTSLQNIYYTREKESDQWKQVPATELTVDQNVIKSLLYEWLGAVDHFNNGKMYYSAPVKNLRYKDDRTPFYGVVRNSWYSFELTDVKRVGTPVDDPAQPIVPLIVDTHDQINVRIRILDWHTVEETVNMLPGDKYLNN